jgi:thiol-disulfide isomerase/thioredoxin
MLSRFAINRKDSRQMSVTPAAFALGLCAALSLALSGCGSKGESEVSAENSGYKAASGDTAAAAKPEAPAETAQAAPETTASNTPATSDPATTAEKSAMAEKAAAAPPVGGTPGPVGNPVAGNNAAAPKANPATPGDMTKTGGIVNEAPSFAALIFPTSEEPADLIAFLLKTDQAIRDLAVYGSQGMIPESEFRQQGAKVMEMKLTAATKLLGKNNLNEEDMRLARKAKLQALSQLSGLGDVKANDQLKAYVDELITTGDPELVHNGRLMQLGYAAEALMAGKSTDPSELLSRIDEVLQDEKYRGAPELMQVRAAMGLLEQMGFKEQSAAVRNKVGKMFENSSDPNLANAAWQLLADQHPSTNAMRAAIDSALKGEPDATEAIKKACSDMIESLPPERTVAFLVGQSVNIEYSGQPQIAQAMLDVVSGHLDKVKEEKVRQQLQKTLDNFKLRQAIVGKELPLSGLVGADGKPIDMTAYAGKVVLVDFWATWCQPCLQELPNVQKTYEALKDKGFEVIGVNMDENAADLEKFLQQQKLPWATVRSGDATKVGFNTPIAQEIGVEAIPFVILIGKDGKVAKLHTRGELLQPAVEELLK